MAFGSGGGGDRVVRWFPLTEPAREITVCSVVPCEQRGDREVGLVAVEVEQLSMTANASSATVWQCHLEMVAH